MLTRRSSTPAVQHGPCHGLRKTARRSLARQRQRGVSLLELMVGIAIGLLVVAVAMAALMASRDVSGTVSDASDIQQQAAYALRVIGLQTRQAGSLYLNLNSGNAPVVNLLAAPVAFETVAAASGSGNSFDPKADTLNGTASSLTVGYRHYKESVFIAATDQAQSRNCAAGPGAASLDQRVESAFNLNGSSLRCVANGAAAQPIVQRVANFQVRYLLQDVTMLGTPTLYYAPASSLTANDWPRVQGVEVCLVLYGVERIGMPSGTSYTDCDGTTSVDMTTLTGDRANRMHLVFRNVFQLRSQGLVGTVL